MSISSMLVPISMDERDEKVLQYVCGLEVQSVRKILIATAVDASGLEAPVVAAEMDRARERLAGATKVMRDCSMDVEVRAGVIALTIHSVAALGKLYSEEIEHIDPGPVEALTASTRPICLFGHTHLPMAAGLTPDRRLELFFHGPRDRQSVRFEAGWRYLINPGSVGQPRDGDPRAAYAVLDTEAHEIEISRVAYPVERAAERIIAAGLPKVLGHRLTLGR